MQPPMAIPLRHFVVGLGFLLVGSALGTIVALDAAPGLARLAHVHLLLVGWVCVTIMGAMTQFIPVWAGVSLHSRRLATLQLLLVAGGLLAFVAALLTGRPHLLALPGFAMLSGFWTFTYNVGRTLATARPLDVTERHFAVALAALLAVTILGVLLALDFAHPLLPDHGRTRAAHATFALFGVVLTTVIGALYQLSTMFTQAPDRQVDDHLRQVEEASYPLGVFALTAGRLLGIPGLARAGAALALLGLLAFTAVLARRLATARVPRTPMLTRYGVVAVALVTWCLFAAPGMLWRPLAAPVAGPPGASHLILVGVIGFVLVGTLYHIVPFVVWVHRYSDRLGLEPVPMIDDLYDDRVARMDFVATLTGLAALFAGATLTWPVVSAAGGLLLVGGFCLFAGNLLVLLRGHAPYTVLGLLRTAVDGSKAR